MTGIKTVYLQNEQFHSDFVITLMLYGLAFWWCQSNILCLLLQVCSEMFSNIRKVTTN